MTRLHCKISKRIRGKKSLVTRKSYSVVGKHNTIASNTSWWIRVASTRPALPSSRKRSTRCSAGIKMPRNTTYTLQTFHITTIKPTNRRDRGGEAAFCRLRREHVDQISLTQDPQLEANIDQCLAHLQISDPRYDKARIESVKGGLLKDCYRWILEPKDFQQWRGDSESHLFWIKGDPGKGKTMLLCGITEELSTAPIDQCLVSYFFCQATDASLNNATAVLRGLVYMLLNKTSHLQSTFTRNGKSQVSDCSRMRIPGMH